VRQKKKRGGVPPFARPASPLLYSEMDLAPQCIHGVGQGHAQAQLRVQKNNNNETLISRRGEQHKRNTAGGTHTHTHTEETMYQQINATLLATTFFCLEDRREKKEGKRRT